MDGPLSICPRTYGPLGSVCPRMNGLPPRWMDPLARQNDVSRAVSRAVSNTLNHDAVCDTVNHSTVCIALDHDNVLNHNSAGTLKHGYRIPKPKYESYIAYIA